MSQFGIKFALPPVGASDVATRELSVAVNNLEPVVTVLQGQPLESSEIVFNSDEVVTVVLSDVDAHGNRSQPSTPLTFTVNDDVAPPQPGALGITSKRQLD